MRRIAPLRTIVGAVALLGAGLIGFTLGSLPGHVARAADLPAATTATTVLPSDVYPESRNRLPLIQRDQLDDVGKQLYDADTVNNSSGRSLAGLQGPGGIQLYSPKLAFLSRQQNQYLRYDGGLDRRLTELAILTVAREVDSQFEWFAHEPSGLKEGLTPALIDIVAYRRPLTGVGEREAALIELGREGFGKHKVSPATFATALRLFGPQTLVNYVELMGDYAGNSFLLTVFDMQLPPGQVSTLPPTR
jgi:4-carboxymuconolactone decarboxylase